MTYQDMVPSVTLVHGHVEMPPRPLGFGKYFSNHMLTVCSDSDNHIFGFYHNKSECM